MPVMAAARTTVPARSGCHSTDRRQPASRSIPMTMMCTRCFTDYDVTQRRLPGKMIEYHCSANHDDTGDHTWITSVAVVTQSFAVEEGVTNELLAPLLACVHAG